RQTALSIYKALIRARELFASGETNSCEILQEMHGILHKAGIFQIDYTSVVDPETLEELEEARPDAVVALACWVGNTRLIDNMGLSETTSLKERLPALSSLEREAHA
ncbi:MAG TPA: pantoate--beta-alanine ligase, partial [Candidatus Hypogeohydataceae bacterium YC38]